MGIIKDQQWNEQEDRLKQFQKVMNPKPSEEERDKRIEYYSKRRVLEEKEVE